jgi:hypothetical protein
MYVLSLVRAISNDWSLMLNPSFQFDPSDLSEGERHARAFLLEEHARPFDLSKDIPARIAIVRVCPDVHFVSAVIHHTSSDEWSAGLIDQELTASYNSFIDGVEPSLNPLPIRYCDYAVWRKQRIQADLLTAQLDYWSKQLNGSRPLELFTDYVRPAKLTGRASEHSFKIEAVLAKALRHLASTYRTSLYVVLLAAFRATIYRTTSEEDGTVGIVNANRTRTELEGIVGLFANTHAIRLSVGSDTSFEQMILQTRQVTAEAFQHSEVPFNQVVAHLVPQCHPSRSPLAQLSK